MQTLSFNVQGSLTEPYEVIFYFINGVLSGSCTCTAGQQSKYCKHRLDLLQGDTEAIVGASDGDLKTALDWYRNSDLMLKVEELKSVKKDIENLKNKQKAIEKSLSKLISR